MDSYRKTVDRREGFGQHRAIDIDGTIRFARSMQSGQIFQFKEFDKEFSPRRTHQLLFQPRHAGSYVECVVARLPATSKLTSGSENPFRRNSRRITSRRLTEVRLSPIGGVALPSLTSKDWGLVVGELGRRTLVLVELGTKAALARLDKP